MSSVDYLDLIYEDEINDREIEYDINRKGICNISDASKVPQEKAEGIPVIWILINNSDKMSWGEIINIQKEQ